MPRQAKEGPRNRRLFDSLASFFVDAVSFIAKRSTGARAKENKSAEFKSLLDEVNSLLSLANSSKDARNTLRRMFSDLLAENHYLKCSLHETKVKFSKSEKERNIVRKDYMGNVNALRQIVEEAVGGSCGIPTATSEEGSIPSAKTVNEIMIQNLFKKLEHFKVEKLGLEKELEAAEERKGELESLNMVQEQKIEALQGLFQEGTPQKRSPPRSSATPQSPEFDYLEESDDGTLYDALARTIECHSFKSKARSTANHNQTKKCSKNLASARQDEDKPTSNPRPRPPPLQIPPKYPTKSPKMVTLGAEDPDKMLEDLKTHAYSITTIIQTSSTEDECEVYTPPISPPTVDQDRDEEESSKLRVLENSNQHSNFQFQHLHQRLPVPVETKECSSLAIQPWWWDPTDTADQNDPPMSGEDKKQTGNAICDDMYEI